MVAECGTKEGKSRFIALFSSSESESRTSLLVRSQKSSVRANEHNVIFASYFFGTGMDCCASVYPPAGEWVALRACEKIGRLLRAPPNARDGVALREKDGHLVH